MKFKTLCLILSLLVVAILSLTACSTTTTVTATAPAQTVTKTTTDTSTIDVINKFIAAEDLMFSSGDGSGLMAVEDDNIIIHMMNWPDTTGNAAHVAAIKGIRDGAAGPITHKWTEITGTGDTGSVRWTETGTVGGQSLTYQGAYFFKVKNGKITEAWLISDMLTYFLAASIVQYAPPPAQ